MMAESAVADPRPPTKSRARSGLAAFAALVLAKAKTIFIALKALKLTSVALTMGSMLTMIWFEARLGGWAFGVGFVLLIFVHEMGHAFALKRAGLAASYPVFIPFVGAFISMRGQPRSSQQEADVAIAGPVAGTLGALACIVAWKVTDARIFLSLAYTAFFLNLFNLAPIPPLDGGRVARMFSRRLWIVGAVVLVGMFVLTHSPQLLLICFIAGSHALRGRGAAPPPDEADVTQADRRNMAIQYFGLAAFIATGMALTHNLLS
jgi:Zn-dependent protease